MPSTEAIRPAIWLTWERVMDATAGVPATRMSFGWSIGRSLPRLALIIGQGFEGVCGEIGRKLGRRRELRMLEELAHLRRGAPGEDNCHKGTQEGHYGRSGWLGRWHCGWIVAGPPAPHPRAYSGREWLWRGLGLGRLGWSRQIGVRGQNDGRIKAKLRAHRNDRLVVVPEPRIVGPEELLVGG